MLSLLGLFVLAAASLSASAATGARSSPRAASDSSKGYDEPLCQSSKTTCADVSGKLGDEYVGHDEPSVLFKSGRPGSGNDMTYTITLPKDPKKQPNASGKGGTTWNFQLRPTFWFGLTLCDTESAPEFTKTCKPDSDAITWSAAIPTRRTISASTPATPSWSFSSTARVMFPSSRASAVPRHSTARR